MFESAAAWIQIAAKIMPYFLPLAIPAYFAIRRLALGKPRFFVVFVVALVALISLAIGAGYSYTGFGAGHVGAALLAMALSCSLLILLFAGAITVIYTRLSKKQITRIG